MLEGQTYERITTAQIRLREAKIQAAVIIDTGEAELRSAIRSARTSGATWPEIGRMFGVSKQAAQKRFGND